MRVVVFLAATALAGATVYCDPYLTNPPQFCPGGTECQACGKSRCPCPESNGHHNNNIAYCNPYLTNPRQLCPGEKPCPLCGGASSCRCPSLEANATSVMVTNKINKVYCDPIPQNPPQFCPGGTQCPNCEANRCECPESNGHHNNNIAYCNPYLTNPPQFCPGEVLCPQCGGASSCRCPSPKADATSVMVTNKINKVYCDPIPQNPPQFCPGGTQCPNCEANRCECPESNGHHNNNIAYCNPYLTNPRQFCPGEKPCPLCGGASSCRCPSLEANATSVMV